MTPEIAYVLDITADLASAQHSVNKAVGKALAFLCGYDDASKALCDAVGPTPGITLCRCGTAAKVAEVIRQIAHQGSYEVAA